MDSSSPELDSEDSECNLDSSDSSDLSDSSDSDDLENWMILGRGNEDGDQSISLNLEGKLDGNAGEFRSFRLLVSWMQNKTTTVFYIQSQLPLLTHMQLFDNQLAQQCGCTCVSAAYSAPVLHHYSIS